MLTVSCSRVNLYRACAANVRSPTASLHPRNLAVDIAMSCSEEGPCLTTKPRRQEKTRRLADPAPFHGQKKTGGGGVGGSGARTNVCRLISPAPCTELDVRAFDRVSSIGNQPHDRLASPRLDPRHLPRPRPDNRVVGEAGQARLAWEPKTPAPLPHRLSLREEGGGTRWFGTKAKLRERLHRYTSALVFRPIRRKTTTGQGARLTLEQQKERKMWLRVCVQQPRSAFNPKTCS